MVRAAILALAFAGVLGHHGPADAQIYRYTDERGNSYYVEGLDRIPERYRGTATALPFRNSPASPPAGTSTTPAASDKEPTTISFVPGQRILTEARINDGPSVRLLLDTGADRTLISPRALVAAGASLTRGAGSHQIQGVTGNSEAIGVVIDSLAVGSARVGRMTVFAHDMNRSDFDGLLGRDFLQQFNVSIDATRGVVTIKPK
jgi:Aspartyl protease